MPPPRGQGRLSFLGSRVRPSVGPVMNFSLQLSLLAALSCATGMPGSPRFSLEDPRGVRDAFSLGWGSGQRPELGP